MNEAVLECRIERVGAAELDALREKGLGQHLLKAALRGPTDFIRGLAQIAVGDQQNFVLRNGGGSHYFRNCIGCHDVFLIVAMMLLCATASSLSRFGIEIPNSFAWAILPVTIIRPAADLRISRLDPAQGLSMNRYPRRSEGSRSIRHQ
jgi:hypothetical protein